MLGSSVESSVILDGGLYLRYCLEEQVDENHLHPTAWYQELKVTGLSKGDIEARYNLR